MSTKSRNLGSAYIKAVKAPVSNIRLPAVGGINDKNMKGYLQAGVVGFSAGLNIIDKQLLEKEDYIPVSLFAEKYVPVIRGAE